MPQPLTSFTKLVYPKQTKPILIYSHSWKYNFNVKMVERNLGIRRRRKTKNKQQKIGFIIVRVVGKKRSQAEKEILCILYDIFFHSLPIPITTAWRATNFILKRKKKNLKTTHKTYTNQANYAFACMRYSLLCVTRRILCTWNWKVCTRVPFTCPYRWYVDVFVFVYRFGIKEKVRFLSICT